MIGRLKGKIIFQGEKHIILDVRDVGYKLYVSAETFKKRVLDSSEAEEVVFWTYLNVKEDALDLYGFLEKAEVEFFETLISVSGVGPKSAIGILNVAPLDTLKKAIANGDPTYLSTVSGIGRKTAEKIIVDLKDKFGRGLDKDSLGLLKEGQDALDALQSLGFSLREAHEALRGVSDEVRTTEGRVKEALKTLGKS